MNAPATESSGNTLRYVLFGILGLLLVALGYDRMVARKHVDAAYEKIDALNRNINASSERRAMTNEDVQKELGRQPSNSYTRDDGKEYVEEYRWMSGLPGKFHTYYAVYSGNKKLFQHHAKFQIPDLSPDVPVGADDAPPTGGPPAGTEKAGALSSAGPPSDATTSPDPAAEATAPDPAAGGLEGEADGDAAAEAPAEEAESTEEAPASP